MLPAGRHVLGVWDEVLPRRPKARLSSIPRPSTSRARGPRMRLAGAGLALARRAGFGRRRRREAAALTFMCGGVVTAFARAKPILEAMGKRIVHCGAPAPGRPRKSATT